MVWWRKWRKQLHEHCIILKETPIASISWLLLSPARMGLSANTGIVKLPGCRYWLAGSCLNPTCAFRHPPLDGRTERAFESASADHQSAVSVNKTNISCYYYYNGFCNKGERCLFMHGPEENAYTWKSSKKASAIVDGPPLDKKMSNGTYSEPVLAEIQSVGIDPKRTTGTKIIAQQESHQFSPNIAAEHRQLNPNNAAEHSVCPQITDSPSEEAATVRSNSPIHTECLIQLKSTDQGLGDELDNHIQQEEWLESSPGFDVLVNDRSEALDYEDEALYLLHHDMEDRECNGQSLVYDYKEDMEYDPAYPDIGVSFEREMSDYYDHLEEDVRNTNLTTPFPVKESVLDRIELRKRKLLQTELAGMDPRDYLKKRGMAESQYTKYFSGRPHSSCLIGKIAEETSTGIRGNLRGGLASKVEISVESLIETENCSNSICQHGNRRRPRVNRSRLQTKERKQVKQQILSEISGKTASRKRRYSQVSTMFTAPKTLAQIKEEKKKALGVAEISLTEEGHQAVMHK